MSRRRYNVRQEKPLDLDGNFVKLRVCEEIIWRGGKAKYFNIFYFF